MCIGVINMTVKKISRRLELLEQQGPTENTDHSVHIYDPATGLDKYLDGLPTDDTDQVLIFIPDNGRGEL